MSVEGAEASSGTASEVVNLDRLFDGSGSSELELVVGQVVTINAGMLCDAARLDPTDGWLAIGQSRIELDLNAESPAMLEIPGPHWGETQLAAICSSDDQEEVFTSSTVLVTDGRPDPGSVRFADLGAEATDGARSVYARDFVRPTPEHAFPVCDFGSDGVDLCLPTGPLSGHDYVGLAAALLERGSPWPTARPILGSGACDPAQSTGPGEEPCAEVTMCNFMRDVLTVGYQIEGDPIGLGLSDLPLIEAVVRSDVEWPSDCDQALNAEDLFEQWARIIEVWGTVPDVDSRRIVVATELTMAGG